MVGYHTVVEGCAVWAGVVGVERGGDVGRSLVGRPAVVGRLERGRVVKVL